jgi:hypothetical protein
MITLKSIIAESKIKSVLSVNEDAPIYKDWDEFVNPHYILVTLKNGKKLKIEKKNVKGGTNVYHAILKAFNDNNHKITNKVVSGMLDRLGESVKEAKDETYFKSATDAVMYARTQAEKKGFEIDDQDWNSEITMGGRYSRTRPGVGKTNSFSVGLSKGGKPQRKNLNISLYGMESGKFELTYYIN